MGRLGAYSGSANQPATSATDRGRADQTASKNPSVGTKFKRSASAGPPTIRDQRKGGVSPSTEKRKEQYTNGFKPSSNQLISATKAQGTPVGTDGSEGFAANPSSMLLANASGPLSAQNTPVNDEAADRRQSVHMDTYNFPRSTGSDRRSEGPRPFDLPRDFAGAVPLRERGDGRPERNRGGYRGRGNGSYGFSNQPHVNGNGYANGNSTQHQVPTMQPAKSHSSHERHERHPSYTQGSASSSHTHPRSFRSNSRSQSIPHSAPYGRYPNGQFPAAPHLANIQTDIANAYGYQPGNQGTMSAVPYSPYADQVTLYGMVSMQM